jgi:hypothetical protein
MSYCVPQSGLMRVTILRAEIGLLDAQQTDPIEAKRDKAIQIGFGDVVQVASCPNCQDYYVR